MALSWNEIKIRATVFSKEWENEISEDAEAKSFWDEFFHVFGIGRRRVATFEQQVKKIDHKTGFIDLLWKGVILVEHKSRGKNLDKAYQQAKDYFPGLREKELPRYILVSDFERFRLYDLEEDQQHEFLLVDFVNQVHHFGFIAGYQKRTYKEQDPVNIEAAELMGKLHDKLKGIGYDGHFLELYLVRLLFCLFADDTNIFEKGILNEYLELKTNEDGSDLAAHISQLFQVLNTDHTKRFKNLDESLAAFPYINGKLFEEQLPIAHFDSEMRRILLDSCLLDWGKISPAIFGSLFQSVMDEKARRNLGAHYTSEKNILKLIKPLFLDELWQDFERQKHDKTKLKKLHDKISKLRFLDPACGCGNFLIIAYREIRLLELDIVKLLLKGQQVTSIDHYFLVDVDKFYGIEYEEFPGLIAQVAMWLMDHQMNEKASLSFGDYFKRIPLKKSATIIHGNALRIDWQSLLQADLSDLWHKDNVDNLRYDYILGNPPFIGSRLMSDSQRDDIKLIFKGTENYGVLDYVAGWYKLASSYLKNRQTKVAFVSTNSICQGEQVPVLWGQLLANNHFFIHFAHKTFRWSNEAKGNAAVFCIIVCFANFNTSEKIIFDYQDVNGEPRALLAKNINAYLVDGKNVFIKKNSLPLSNVPKLIRGSIPYDNGFLLLSKEEAESLINRDFRLRPYVKKYGGASELINNEWRYCLWLKNIEPALLKSTSFILDRVEKVRQFRINSKGQSVKSKASTPALFGDIRQPGGENYLLIPRHSSERRRYIPIGFISQETILADSAYGLPNATLYHFGFLTSNMHMTWIKITCGRIKSDYRYSKDIVYNNFPWPENPTLKQKETVEAAAQSVLDIRASFPNSSLADLYDPNTMPPELVKAHHVLDKAVDLCYRSQQFTNDTKRIEFLFELYDKYTAGLFVKEKKARNNKNKSENS